MSGEEREKLKYRDVMIRLPATQEAIDNARKLLDLLENDLAGGGMEYSKVQQGASQQSDAQQDTSPKKKRRWSDEERDIIANNLDKKPAELRHLLWLYGYERSYGAVDQQQRKLLESQRQEEGDEETEETPEPEQQLSGDWKQLTTVTSYMVAGDRLYIKVETDSDFGPSREFHMDDIREVFNELPDVAAMWEIREAINNYGENVLGMDVEDLMWFLHRYVEFDAELIKDGGVYKLDKENYSVNDMRKQQIETERSVIDQSEGED